MKTKQTQSNEEYILRIRDDASVIRYIQNPTEQMCREAVQKHPLMIQFIQNPSHEVCMAAVKQRGCSLMYVPSHCQTEAICFAAIRNDPFALQWVTNQTEQMCLEAVSVCGMAIFVVHRITPRIVKAAIQNDIAVAEMIRQGKLHVQ